MSQTHRFLVSLLALSFAVGLAACGRHDDTGVAREPLAKTATAPSAVVAAPAGGTKPSDAAPGRAKDEPKRTDSTSKAADDSEPTVTPPKSAKRVSSKDVAPSSTSAADGIELKRLVITRAIEHREPVETATFSTSGEPIFAFVELASDLGEPGEISLSFEHDGGKSVGHVKLAVPEKSSRWRTWGKTRLIKTPGTWTAVVRRADGSELGRKSFEVE